MSAAESQISFKVLARRSRNANERRWHALICSYFDDSADEQEKRFVSSGGIVGSEIFVDVFEGLWIAQTKDLKEPFRSTECECQQGQFKNWTKPDCDALITRLIDIICHPVHFVGGFASVVPVPLYREVFPLSEYRDPYRLSVAHTIVEMARLAKRNNEKIKLWFEDSEKDHALIDAMYRNLKALTSWQSDERHRLFGISFDDKTLAPLQAADLVAREGFKASDNLGKRDIRKPLLRMWDRVGIVQWGRDGLELLKNRGWPDNLHPIVSLPDWAYVHPMRNDGTQYFTQTRRRSL